ncbi:MAG TPA: hypothetical protein DC047_13345 [Blastocatellia bacterium]|nr:hypothetical protein [Blastocatellia bacterium]
MVQRFSALALKKTFARNETVCYTFATVRHHPRWFTRLLFIVAAAAWYLTFSRGEETVIMAKTVAKIMGLVLLLVGVLGFTHVLDSLGAHLSPAHNLVHILTGVIALYFGFAGSLSGAKGFCIIFGLVYLLLGILGLAMGELHIGPLMLGKVDHGIHLIVGAIFLAGGLFTKNP